MKSAQLKQQLVTTAILLPSKYPMHLGELVDVEKSTQVEELIKILYHDRQSYYQREQALKTLESMATENLDVIQALIELLHREDFAFSSLKVSLAVIDLLGRVGVGNSGVIEALVNLLQTSSDTNLCIRAAETLQKIDLGNQKAIAALVKRLQAHCVGKPYGWNVYLCKQAANLLLKVDPGNQKAIETLNAIYLHHLWEEQHGGW